MDACERAAHSAAFIAESAAAFVAPLIAELSGTADDERVGDPEPLRHDATEPTDVETVRTALAGRYDVERELGRGGMATVYLARDRRHGRAVALKVLDRALGAAMRAARCHCWPRAPPHPAAPRLRRGGRAALLRLTRK